MTDTTNTTRLYICIEEVVRLLNNAECYAFVSVDEQLAYLEDRAQLLHQLVDAFGDERGRYVAQDADDRAERARAVAEARADECGDPRPAPRRPEHAVIAVLSRTYRREVSIP
ncbi:hypothetical protein AB0C18_07820 [Nonomuraea muscovyensis]|uniref:hypothetical protein n=1 Tax=Nonomuraea muscovyensis TaxID=1124761 RepID=UPI0033C1C26F